jgi:dGTPase
LTEASDDICYAIVDLEDGYRNGLISFKEIKELFENVISEDSRTTYSLDKIKDETEQIGYLRAKAINALINMCTEAFVTKHDEILSGTFQETLIDVIPPNAREAYQEIKIVEKKQIYTHKNILLTEAAGFVVLPGLLDLFVRSAFDDNDRSRKIRDCILKDMVVDDPGLECEQRNYNTLMNIIEFVSLMTDNYAVKLYRELNGIQLPNY